MKMKLLLLAGLLTSSAYADSTVEYVSSQPNYVYVNQEQCEMREVFVENRNSGRLFRSDLLGGAIGAALGNEIGGGSGRRIATATSALIGANVARNISSRNSSGTTQYRNVCRNVRVQVQQGKLVTVRIDGRLHTILTQ